MKMTINTQFARVTVELTPEDAGELILMAVRMATPKPPMSLELRELMTKLPWEDTSAEESGGGNGGAAAGTGE